MRYSHSQIAQGPGSGVDFPQNLPANVSRNACTRAIRYLRFIRSPISSRTSACFTAIHDRSEPDRPISLRRDDVGERDSGSGSRARFCVQGDSSDNSKLSDFVVAKRSREVSAEFFPAGYTREPVSPRARARSINPSLHFIAYKFQSKITLFHIVVPSLSNALYFQIR